MVLDTAKPKYKKSTIWLGMRGRDVVRKSTREHFTSIHDRIPRDPVYRESRLAVGRSEQKSGMNMRKKTIHINSLQRKDEDTKDNGILLQTTQEKMGL